MSNKYYVEYKNVGETTGDFSQRLYKKYNNKIAICGKLDPMAHGLVIILVGDNTKLMPQYLTSIKVYKFTICTKLSTDSDDIMGIPFVNESHPINNIKTLNEQGVDDLIYNYCLNTIQPFHHFSAINITKNNIRKPLHYWYLREQLTDNDIPTKVVNVYDIIKCPDIIISNYYDYVLDKLNSIKPQHFDTFRLNEIIEKYKEYEYILNQPTSLRQYIITVSSGFYIRMISKFLRVHCNINCHISDIERLNSFHFI